jgi:ATP-dependent DNA helicase RecG
MSKTIMISETDSLALSTRKEDDLFDRKSATADGRAVQKIAVAFANADGGELVLGVADEKAEADPNKRWSGLTNPEGYNSHLQALFNLNPTVDFRHEFLLAEGKEGYVLRIYIEKSAEVAKTGDGKVYQRKGAQSLPVIDPERIQSLAFAKGARSYESTPLPNVRAEEIVDSREMARFCGELKPTQEPLAFTVNEGLIDRSEFVPNCAGILLYSDNPQAVFPKRCGIKVVFYDTKLEIPERDHLIVNETISGSLYELAHQAATRVSAIMSGISISTADGLTKVSYPPEAIWEVLVNALIHRDYSIADDVQILIFQNRIEIKSPGRLPGFVTEENYLDVRYSRNPKIVRCLARYRNPPNKDLGEGLNTAFQKMKEWKLSAPKLFQEGNYVRVIISHTPLARPEELVLAFLKTNPEIRSVQAREITGIRSENQMKNVFYRLRDQGTLERVPGKQGNAAAWRLTQSEDTEPAV